MQENSDNQIALFVRDERTGRRAFNAQALKALGIDPADARDRGYPLENLTGLTQTWPPKSKRVQSLDAFGVDGATHQGVDARSKEKCASDTTAIASSRLTIGTGGLAGDHVSGSQELKLMRKQPSE